jgi:hypothetical protein
MEHHGQQDVVNVQSTLQLCTVITRPCQSAEDISSMILKKMKDLGEEHLGVPSKDAVITVPRYPTDAQRRDTHTRRTTITTSDIDKALRVLNIKAHYGHNPHNRDQLQPLSDALPWSSFTNHTTKRCQLDRSLASS